MNVGIEAILTNLGKESFSLKGNTIDTLLSLITFRQQCRATAITVCLTKNIKHEYTNDPYVTGIKDTYDVERVANEPD